MLKTSSANILSKNLLLSINVAKVDEVGIGGDGDSEDTNVRKYLSKNSKGVIDYLTPDTRQAFTQLRQSFTKAPIL